MLFLRGLVEGVAKRTGALPADRAALRAAIVARDSRLARPIDLAFTDGWGRAIGYAVDGDAFAPLLDAEWQETARENHVSASGLPFAFVTYARQP